MLPSSPLTGNVEDCRAGLGRSLCSQLTRIVRMKREPIPRKPLARKGRGKVGKISNERHYRGVSGQFHLRDPQAVG
jgi:hypothetical protein